MNTSKNFVLYLVWIMYLFLLTAPCYSQKNTISFSVKTSYQISLIGRCLYYDYCGMFPDSIYNNQKLPYYLLNQLTEKEYKVYDPVSKEDSLKKPLLLSMQKIKERVSKKELVERRIALIFDFDEKWDLDTVNSNIKRQSNSMTIKYQSVDTIDNKDGSKLIITGEGSMATMYYNKHLANRFKKRYEHSYNAGVYCTEISCRDTTSFFYNTKNRMLFLNALMKGIENGDYKVKRIYDEEELNYNDFINYVTDDKPEYFSELLSDVNELFIFDYCYVDPKTLYVHKELKSVLLFGTMEIEINSFDK